MDFIWFYAVLMAILVTRSCGLSCSACLGTSECLPPNCSCCGDTMPLPRKDKIPQMVFFTFDDAITSPVADFYRSLFNTKKKNPNGCPISMTLFVSHGNTNYRLVREFYNKGMEIAAHSVTHNHLNESTFGEEALNQKAIIAKEANIPLSEIKGWRSPYLEPVGDLQPDTLKRLNYTYDATLTVDKKHKYAAPIPFTLDFGWPYECKIKPCPVKPHPKFWEVPVVTLKDHLDQFECVYVDGCNNPPPNADAAFKFLWNNFETYYKGNRAPFGVNMHASWFFYPERLAGMEKFINELVKLRDVYIVSAAKVIDWFKYPTSLDNIENLDSWECEESRRKRLELKKKVEEEKARQRELQEKMKLEVEAREKASIVAYQRAKEEETIRMHEEEEQVEREKKAREAAERIKLELEQKKKEYDTLRSRQGSERKASPKIMQTSVSGSPRRQISSTILWGPSNKHFSHGLIGVPVPAVSRSLVKKRSKLSESDLFVKMTSIDVTTSAPVYISTVNGSSSGATRTVQHDPAEFRPQLYVPNVLTTPEQTPTNLLTTETPTTISNNQNKETDVQQSRKTNAMKSYITTSLPKSINTFSMTESIREKHTAKITPFIQPTKGNEILTAVLESKHKTKVPKLPSTLQLLRILGWLHTHVANAPEPPHLKQNTNGVLSTRNSDQPLSEWVSHNRPILQKMLQKISNIIHRNAQRIMKEKARHIKTSSRKGIIEGNVDGLSYNYQTNSETHATQPSSNDRSLHTLPTTKSTTPNQRMETLLFPSGTTEILQSVIDISETSPSNTKKYNDTLRASYFIKNNTHDPIVEAQPFVKKDRRVTITNPYGISLQSLIPGDGLCFKNRICQLCGCNGVPQGLDELSIPQFVVITIESSLNFVSYSKLTNMFRRQRLNPNNCPISGTVFIKNNKLGQSNKPLLTKLFNKSLDVGILVPNDIETDIETYIKHRKKAMTSDSNVDQSMIKGIRVTNHKHLRELDSKYLAKNQMYDSSMVSDVPSWPKEYGIDDSNCTCYSSRLEPAEFALTPIVSNLNYEECLYADNCSVSHPSISETFKMFFRSFEKHYNTHRKPFGIHITDKWFDVSHHQNLAGLTRFLDNILKYDDVFIVSIDKLLKWTRHPKLIIPTDC